MTHCEQLYPVIIQAVVNKVLVRVFHQIGINKFQNPRCIDELWCDEEDFLGFIYELVQPIRSCFVQLLLLI